MGRTPLKLREYICRVSSDSSIHRGGQGKRDAKKHLRESLLSPALITYRFPSRWLTGLPQLPVFDSLAIPFQLSMLPSSDSPSSYFHLSRGFQCFLTITFFHHYPWWLQLSGRWHFRLLEDIILCYYSERWFSVVVKRLTCETGPSGQASYLFSNSVSSSFNRANNST